MNYPYRQDAKAIVEEGYWNIMKNTSQSERFRIDCMSWPEQFFFYDFSDYPIGLCVSFRYIKCYIEHGQTEFKKGIYSSLPVSLFFKPYLFRFIEISRGTSLLKKFFCYFGFREVRVICFIFYKRLMSNLASVLAAPRIPILLKNLINYLA